MNHCTHSEVLKFSACSRVATYRFRRFRSTPSTPWRYVCQAHMDEIAKKVRERIVVQRVETV